MQAKKKLNIPICDVLIDPDYETNVTATYFQPQTYVRYVRKIGDEADFSIDYSIEDEDLVSAVHRSS
jgi:hypothetical protein